MNYRVVCSERALSHLDELYYYIAESSDEARAAGYVERILAHCHALKIFPLRGTARPDIRPGLRTMGFEKRATIVFSVKDTVVDILGIYYGGQDFEREYRQEDEPK